MTEQEYRKFPLPSVTEIISFGTEAPMYWTDAARDRGIKAHAEAEISLLMGSVAGSHPRVNDFVRDTGYSYMDVELSMFGDIDGLKFKGRLDTIGFFPNGRLCLIDFKSNMPNKDMVTQQGAAYIHLYCQINGLNPADIDFGVFVLTTGSWREINRAEVAWGRAMFKERLQAVWRDRNMSKDAIVAELMCGQDVGI